MAGGDLNLCFIIIDPKYEKFITINRYVYYVIDERCLFALPDSNTAARQ